MDDMRAAAEAGDFGTPAGNSHMKIHHPAEQTEGALVGRCSTGWRLPVRAFSEVPEAAANVC
jgi:hypothetical protein